MTVQELIDELNKIEDKSQKVFSFESVKALVHIDTMTVFNGVCIDLVSNSVITFKTSA